MPFDRHKLPRFCFDKTIATAVDKYLISRYCKVDNGQVIGELPMKVIADESAQGVIFNAGDLSERRNLRLEHHQVWTDPKTGITYMPFSQFSVSKKEGLNPGKEGLWDYEPFEVQATFSMTLFMVLASDIFNYIKVDLED